VDEPPVPPAIVVTCEHGGNEVPAEYAAAFRGAAKVLAGHRGYDPGALELARRFAAALDAPLFFGTVSRLVVELNRSPHHRALFSRYTRSLPAETRAEILARHYTPYRRAVEQRLGAMLSDRRARALHLSVHTFTPVLDGDVRRADVGLLYDPRRAPEVAWCQAWRESLRKRRPDLVIRRNYPYRGTSDGFVTYLRRRFAADRYAGIELEVNQKYPLTGGAAWQELMDDLVGTLRASMTKM
jgi:predicted N-formylglutamate amidohydrolase